MRGVGLGWRTSKAGSGHHTDGSWGPLGSRPSPRRRAGHGDAAGMGTFALPDPGGSGDFPKDLETLWWQHLAPGSSEGLSTVHQRWWQQ